MHCLAIHEVYIVLPAVRTSTAAFMGRNDSALLPKPSSSSSSSVTPPPLSPRPSFPLISSAASPSESGLTMSSGTARPALASAVAMLPVAEAEHVAPTSFIAIRFNRLGFETSTDNLWAGEFREGREHFCPSWSICFNNPLSFITVHNQGNPREDKCDRGRGGQRGPLW